MSKHYHFIGIGGIGMSGIAHLLLQCGSSVSGSDVKPNKITEELSQQGAVIHIGHSAGNIAGADVVVYSSAIKENNPELMQARARGVTVMMRAQALAGLMKDKTVIAVAGSHGKTTTTSLAALLLIEAGLHPTVAVGGVLRNIDANACLGKGTYFVAEADESDGSFLYYDPVYTIVTNIDKEHLDYYKDFDAEIEAFRKFFDNTRPGGCIFYCRDDAVLNTVMSGYSKRAISFGLTQEARMYARAVEYKGLSAEFDAYYDNKYLGRFSLALGGSHNVSNALGVIALGIELGIDVEHIKTTLRDYKGAQRRLEIRFAGEHLMLIDDYAHHPTEIKATLAAVKKLNSRRVVAIFQPHRYTRTSLLLEEFGRSFNDADYVIITDIYAASEPPIEGVTGELLARKIRECAPGKKVFFCPKDEVSRHLFEIIAPGDIVMTLGAGDIVRLGDGMVEELKVRERVYGSA